MPEYWLVGTKASAGARKLHTNRNCRSIGEDTHTRKATPVDVDKFDECAYCAGTVERADPDWSYQKSLKEAGQ